MQVLIVEANMEAFSEKVNSYLSKGYRIADNTLIIKTAPACENRYAAVVEKDEQ